jgi:hypothetical protein
MNTSLVRILIFRRISTNEGYVSEELKKYFFFIKLGVKYNHINFEEGVMMDVSLTKSISNLSYNTPVAKVNATTNNTDTNTASNIPIDTYTPTSDTTIESPSTYTAKSLKITEQNLSTNTSSNLLSDRDILERANASSSIIQNIINQYTNKTLPQSINLNLLA